MDEQQLMELIAQLKGQANQKPGSGGGFKVGSGWSPYEEFQRWDQMNNMFHGALGAQASMLPFGGREWGINAGILAANGAPKSVVQAAQSQQQLGYTPASLFTQKLNQMFGNQIRAQHPGIENIDLNSLMGGKIGQAYTPPESHQLSAFSMPEYNQLQQLLHDPHVDERMKKQILDEYLQSGGQLF